MPMEDMLEMLKSCCRRELERLYPAGVPPAAMWRYRHELELVERAGTAEEYLLFREISKAAERTFSKIYVPNLTLFSFIKCMQIQIHCFCPI